MGKLSFALIQEQRLQMVLAPQLRQSLEMLQLPMLELRTMVQQELEQNPTLEETPAEQETIEVEPGQSEIEENKELDFSEEFESLARLDEEWADYFFQEEAARPYTREDAERRQFFLDSLQQKESLQQHLMSQLNLAGLSDSDREIGELIIGSIDDDGYLTTSLKDLAATSGVDRERLADALVVVQDFDPMGVGARDLKECLQLQLERLGKTDGLPWIIVSRYLRQLGARRYREIARTLKIPIDQVQEAANVIAQLDPKPGRAYSTDVATYVLPEVVVRKIEGEYVVFMNDDQMPHLRISGHYRSLLRNAGTRPEVREYVRDKVRASAFLIKSIAQRQDTIYRIATEIVRVQRDFLDHGIAHLKPLTMAEVANVVKVHETTVSRAVAGKYMQTPSGLFEMKYFFTPGLRTANGSEVSNKTVKDMIAGLVEKESTWAPLSDQEIVDCLREQGIHVARRTVAKYRLVLRIPPSHMRRKYA